MYKIISMFFKVFSIPRAYTIHWHVVVFSLIRDPTISIDFLPSSFYAIQHVFLVTAWTGVRSSLRYIQAGVRSSLRYIQAGVRSSFRYILSPFECHSLRWEEQPLVFSEITKLIGNPNHMFYKQIQERSLEVQIFNWQKNTPLICLLWFQHSTMTSARIRQMKTDLKSSCLKLQQKFARNCEIIQEFPPNLQ
jgi:hypothetical protein